MRILVDVFHPAGVHFFKNLLWEMQRRGHEVLVSSRDKDVSLALLESYGFPYVTVGKYSKNLLLKGLQVVRMDHSLYRIAREFKPDILLGKGAVNAAHVSRLIGKPCIQFADDEYSLFLYRSCADVICTMGAFRRDIGPKQVRINSFKELAYLHPRYFVPDAAVLASVGLRPGDRYAVVRFVAWSASHDFGRHGLDLAAKRKVISELQRHARVFVTSERPLPEDLRAYAVPVPPEKIHHLLYYATLLFGDTQTMTTESALLGTPAIRCNSFVGPGDMASFVELEEEYGLIHNFRDPEPAIRKAVELLSRSDTKSHWAQKRERLLAEKVDVTQFMIDFISNYPESFYRLQRESR